MHRARKITTGAVFVKIDYHNCMRLSEDHRVIRDELKRNLIMLGGTPNIEYYFKGRERHMKHSSFNELWILNESARRKNGRFKHYFKQWTEEEGGIFRDLKLSDEDLI